MLITAFVAAIVYLPMLLEARRSAANERVQLARGGVEPTDDVFKMMRIAYPGAFLLMIVDGALGRPPEPAAVAAGAALFVASKALKWWAIHALGRAWTFRVIVVPGAPLVAGGPYRFVRHPNYVGVVGELVAVALMTGSRIGSPIAVVGFGLLMLKRIAVEQRALAGDVPGV
ncbi:MAG: isoprenylcysteine carboxylmethyltransferase family protein [Acidobacteriota bacterium]